MSGQKPKVYIYVNPDARSTKILTAFIAKHIDQINRKMFVQIVNINKKNYELIKRRGVQKAPTLIFGDKHIVSLEKIIQVLTPRREARDNFGVSHMSADEMVHAFHDSILNTGDGDEEDETDPVVREQVIRQKMAAMQKRRPQMSDDVGSKQRLKGGRKIKSKPPQQNTFEDDASFMRAMGADNFEATPSQRYMDDADGELMLEDYYLDIANASGKKVGKVVSKRR
jgi:hypothetical protein